jgi:hypothetical protein
LHAELSYCNWIVWVDIPIPTIIVVLVKVEFYLPGADLRGIDVYVVEVIVNPTPVIPVDIVVLVIVPVY